MKDQKEIKIAYYENYPPIYYKENNELKVILIDISRHIFQNKIKFKLVQKGFPWESAQMLVKNGEFNSHFTVKTDKREEYLLFQNRNTTLTRDVIAYSKKNNLKLVKISNLYNVIAMINLNRKDILITANDLGIKYIIKKNNIYIKYHLCKKPSEIEFKFCLLKSFPNSNALMAEFNKNLTIAKNSGIIDKIISKYL